MPDNMLGTRGPRQNKEDKPSAAVFEYHRDGVGWEENNIEINKITSLCDKCHEENKQGSVQGNLSGNIIWTRWTGRTTLLQR